MSISRAADPVSIESLEIVREAIAQGIPASFDQLVARCGGLFPVDIVSALRELMPPGISIPDLVANRDPPPPVQPDRPAKYLAVPHPLDFDWRFDDATAGELFERSCKATDDGDVVVFCGTPTVYVKAVRDTTGRIVHLHDINASTHNLATPLGQPIVQSIDFASATPPLLAARYVIADPPWYPEYNALFLWWSAQITSPGATITLVLAPLNTRPTIKDERAQMWSWAERLGLSVRSIEAEAIRYETPPFERSALAAAGVSANANWRTGDLATLDVAGTPEPLARPILPRSIWIGTRLGRTEVRFRQVASTVPDPRLIRLVAGDTLDSVSTRDPRRAGAMVWTALNRIYACHNPPLAHLLAEAISAGTSDPAAAVVAFLGRTPTTIETSQVRQAFEQLQTLATCENTTIARYYDY